jgi:polyisoprenoid-binding protein YceI
MKKIVFSLFLLSSIVSFAQSKKATAPLVTGASTWSVEKSHAAVKFSITHMGISETEGNFKVFDGSIEAPQPDFINAKVNFSVDVNSINTDNEKRDGHLKGDDFFNVEKYPTMKFVGTSFKKVKGTNYLLEGNLTIRDVTKKVKFAVTHNGIIKDPYGMTRAGFKATSTINRKEYGLKWNAILEAGGLALSEDVNVVLNLEFVKK